MKLTDEVYLVGGGNFAFGLSGDLDAHVYAIEGGDEIALVDCGMGDDSALNDIVANLKADGLDLARVRKLLLTHYHADHAGGASKVAERLGLAVYASRVAAPALRNADEDVIGLNIAKAAGFYPESYHIYPCPIERELAEGDSVRVGGLTIEVFDTPGHCHGHLSFVMQGKEKRYLFGGDLAFFGGEIILQNIPDCNIQDYGRSVFKLEGQRIDAFLPGHVTISLRNGQRHVDAAAAAFRRLAVPPNLI